MGTVSHTHTPAYEYNRYTYRTLFDIDVYNLDIFVRLIPFIRLHILDRMHRLQPRKNAPKYRVFLVEPRRRIRSDEELGSVRVRSCVRHTHSIRPVKNGRIKTQAVNRERSVSYRSCFNSSENSSSNSRSQMLVPPVPSPSGSPVWIMNLVITRWKSTPS